MTLGKSATAPAGAKFFDCDAPLSGSAIAAFKSRFSGAARYLSRANGQGRRDLSLSEARLILAAGLAIVPVQHVAIAGWMPSAELGTVNGRAAALNAASVGCPAGVNVWLDLEGVSPHATADVVVAHCEAWFGEVRKAGYEPGLYVGTPCGLDAVDLYHRLSVKHYWHAGSSSAPIPVVRGVQILQRIANQVLAGIHYDSNTVQMDNKGDLPVWWVA